MRLQSVPLPPSTPNPKKNLLLKRGLDSQDIGNIAENEKSRF